MEDSAGRVGKDGSSGPGRDLPIHALPEGKGRIACSTWRRLANRSVAGLATSATE